MVAIDNDRVANHPREYTVLVYLPEKKWLHKSRVCDQKQQSGKAMKGEGKPGVKKLIVPHYGLAPGQ